jgi:hypothetical protein
MSARKGGGIRKGRLALDDRGEKLEAHVRPRWFLASVAWFCFVVAFWVVIGALTLPAVFYGQELSRDYMLWGAIWIVMLVCICYVSRNYLITETLVLVGGVLTLKRSYLVFARTESFRAEEVENLRAAGHGTVEFEAGGGTRWLRTPLEERDARRLVEELGERLNG